MSSARVRVGLMLALEPDFLVTTQSLFERGEVEAVSLSVDFAWMREVPDWAAAVIREYAAAGALYGHAIHYSTVSALAAPNETWLEGYAQSGVGGFGLLSAHHGLSVAPGYARGAPLPVPFSTAAVRAGRTWLRRLATVANCAVGLENLALAFSLDDVWSQGAFLEALLDEADGFVTLDVHNVYCQAVNFGLDPYAILATYPLERVRELHVSGGSIGRSSAEPDRDVRQDTHDGDLPGVVLDLASWVVARAPALEAVFFERLGGTIGLSEPACARVLADYAALRTAVEEAQPSGRAGAPTNARPCDDAPEEQAALEGLLLQSLRAPSPAEAKRALVAGAAAPYAGYFERTELRMLDLGRQVVREWFRP